MAVKLLSKLRWLGHDSFLIEGPPVIYFDPWRLGKGLPVADLILVSHEHGDHCSPQDVKRVSGPDTVIIANETAAAQLSGDVRAPAHPRDVRVMRPGDEIVVGEVTVQAVPAYNVSKFRSPGVPFHPQSSQHNGYVVQIGGERIYFAGDTDHIPEMADLECDIALLPVSGTYVMTAEEAAEAARTIQPQVAVPMHYGAGVAGTASDAERFAVLCGSEVFVFASP